MCVGGIPIILASALRTALVLCCTLTFSGAYHGVQGVTHDHTFDFIVVGAGSAGCAVAGRLSENEEFTVLLLEAGQVPDPTLDIPALAANASFGGPNGDYVKIYSSVPQANVAQDDNGIVSYWGGHALGGGSAVNMMVANRGSHFDYDNWARITGDESWSYRSMLKYFRRMEDYQGDYPSDQHGFGGPITIGRARYAPGEQFWLQAGKYLGYASNVDQNGPQRISFTTVENNKKFGRRVSTYTGYIKPALERRRNLVVIVGAFVTKIQFQANRAISVLYRDANGRLHSAGVRKEVILSAGVFNSPAILLRSGVGPREILEENHITPVTFLPVGKNLHDHVSIRLDFVVGNNSLIFLKERDLNPETWRIYNSIGDGPYAIYGANAQYFIRSPRDAHSRLVEPNENDNWANINSLLVFGGLGSYFYPFLSEEIKMAKREGGAIITPFFTRPRSRGTLKLNITDIEADPILDFQYLSHPQDVVDLLHAIKVSLDVIEKTPSFGRIGARYPPNPLSSCKHLKFRSEEYWRCFIRQTANSGHHAAGTCRMGQTQDPRAVVDPNLKVINLQNVRVSDTSIQPTVVNANTMLSAIVIGEKTADMILSSHRQNKHIS